MPQELLTTTERQPMAVPMQTRRSSPVADAILANVLRCASPTDLVIVEIYDDGGRLLNWVGGSSACVRKLAGQ